MNGCAWAINPRMEIAVVRASENPLQITRWHKRGIGFQATREERDVEGRIWYLGSPRFIVSSHTVLRYKRLVRRRTRTAKCECHGRVFLRKFECHRTPYQCENVRPAGDELMISKLNGSLEELYKVLTSRLHSRSCCKSQNSGILARIRGEVNSHHRNAIS